MTQTEMISMLQNKKELVQYWLGKVIVSLIWL